VKIEELEERLKVLEDRTRRLHDIEEVQKLQRIYGYYVERGQIEELVDLFSDNHDVSYGPSYGVTVGKDNVKKMLSSESVFWALNGRKPDDYLHITAPISGVVDIDESGKTAKARWYALMYLHNATPGGGAVFGVGMYENEYIKEDGKWRILRLQFDDIFLSPYEDGWAKTPKLWAKLRDMVDSVGPPPGDVPDQPRSKSPFGDQMPFHYRHPITGN
jgi:hypothetical protein